MSPPIKYKGPATSEQLLIELWDQIDSTRLRSGEKAATVLAKRALYAAQGDEMDYINEIAKILKTTSPDQIIVGLRALRDAAELAGDMDSADEYTEAIKNTMEAADAGALGTAPTDDINLTQKSYRAALDNTILAKNAQLNAELPAVAPAAPIDPNDAGQVAKAVREGKIKAEAELKKIYRRGGIR